MAETDIRKTGITGLRGLPGINRQPQYDADNDILNQVMSEDLNAYLPQNDRGVGISAAEAGYGNSQYDDAVTSETQFDDLNEVRYNEQPWYDTLANGIGKMLGTAGTTFVSSLVGLPYGLYEAANQGRWSALWDNDVTQGLSEVDNWLEENMTNYRSQVQQNSPWYSPENLLSMNFIADDIIKNAGFTLGAAASMAVGSGSLGLMGRALGFVNDVGKTTKGGAALLSALFSATGEGMIEAKQGVDERNKLEMQRLDDALTPEYQALEMQKQEIDNQYAMTGDYQTYRQQMQDWAMQKQTLDDRKAAGQQQIIESGQEMGNTILLANQGLLTLGNLIQFGKGMVKSFDSARHAAEVSSKAAKPLGVSATRVSKNIKDGYELTGKNFGRAIAATKGILTEGSEEMNQQWAQSGAGAYYTEKDVNDYWKARLDPDSYRETTKGLYTFGQALDRGFQESWGDVDQWEQFVIGGLTGMAGSYAPTKLFNQDKTKARWDPRRYGSWEGGAYNEIRNFNKQYNQYQENVDDLNKILQSEDFPARMQSMVGHTFLETQKADAVNADDMKAWKDADDKQNIHDIQAFLRAGRLDDLRAIYQEMGSNLSDDEIDNIVKSTTKEISAEEDKQNFDRTTDEIIARHQRKITELQQQAQNIGDNQEGLVGSERADYQAAVAPALENIFKQIDDEYDAIDKLNQQKQDYVGQKRYEGAYVDDKGNRTATNDEIRETVKHNSEELNRKLDSYLDSIETVNKMTNGKLSKEQEDNLAYLHNLSKESNVRFEKIMQKVRKQMPSKFLLKTEKTPEQLQKQFTSSDLAFTKDENTKKGYVEVDTSLMNDTAFGIFFMDNIIGGNNIEAKDEKQAEKDSKEQLKTNEDIIKQAFVDNAMKNDGMSLTEALGSEQLGTLIDNINDASSLHSQAAQFYNTYLEYMLNPQKVDQDKRKEEKKVEDKEKKKEAEKAGLGDMLKKKNSELAAILSDAKKGKNNAGDKARKALGIKNASSTLKKALEKKIKAGTLDEGTAADALTLLDSQLNAIAQEEEDDYSSSMDSLVKKMFDTDSEAMTEAENLLTDAEWDDMENGVEPDYAALDERVSKARDAINEVFDSLSKELQDMENSLTSEQLAAAVDDDDHFEKRDAAVQKASDDEKKDQAPTKKKPKVNDEPAPLKAVRNKGKSKAKAQAQPQVQPTRTTTEGNAQALVDDKKKGEKGDNIPEEGKLPTNWHPWRSATSEISYYGNGEYTPAENDPNGEKKKKRYDAVKKKLTETGAYTARKLGKVTEGMIVGFKVFQDVNDAADDFVIFITDKDGNVIIGDLPSNNPQLETSKTDVSMDALYRKIQDEWNDATEQEKKDGVISSYTSVVDHVLMGKIRYQENNQTVSELFEGSGEKPLFAVKVRSQKDSQNRKQPAASGETILNTKGVDGVNPPLTGNAGQPYVLIPTPVVHSGVGRFKYYAVPVHTKTVEEARSSSPLFEEVLTGVLQGIKTGAITDAQAAYVLEELIAVGNVHVNLDEGSNTKKGLGIYVTSFERQSKVEQGVPYSIYSGSREDMDVDKIIDALSRFRVNISLNRLNDSEANGKSAQMLVNGNPVDYNQMIAEVAETNAAEPQTVNDWFTVRPLTGTMSGGLEMAERKDKLPEWKSFMQKSYSFTPHLKGKENTTWTVKAEEGYAVYDEQGRAIESGDNTHTSAEKAEAHRLAAEAFGLYNLRNMDAPYVCLVEGTYYVYDPVKRTFKKPEVILDPTPTYSKKASRERKEKVKNMTPEERYAYYQSLLNHVYVQDYLDMVAQKTAEEEEKKKGAVDHTEEVNKALQAMREESTHYHLVKWDEEQKKYVEDPNGDYYQDDRNGTVHARVSNINAADIEVIDANKKAAYGKMNPQLKTVSTGGGNVVDRFVRNYFKNGDPLKGIGLIKEGFDSLPTEIKAKIEDQIRRIQEPNISHQDAQNLVIALHNFAESLGKDWEIDSSGIVAEGIVSLDRKNMVNVAGTIDLLAYNPKEGKYVIIDMKTHKANIYNAEGNLDVDNVKTQATVAHWRAQQTMYKQFLESKFAAQGVKINGIRILPFTLDYSTKFNETDYAVENGVVKDKGVTVDIHPRYDGKLIRLEPKTDVKYDVSQLPDSVKRILPKQKPIVRKPVDKKVPLKTRLYTVLGYLEELPEGTHLRDFLREAGAKDKDVIKLADILESNANSTAPVLMTEASQNLLILEIDNNKLFNAVQQARLAKKDIHIDIPERDDSEDFNMDDLDSDQIELLEELSEETQRKIKSGGEALKKFIKMSADEADTDEIEAVISSLSKAARHKKATNMPYKKLNLQEELRWLHRNLPQVSKERKLRIIRGLIGCSDGTYDFGRFEDGIIQISTLAEDGTVFHEAFHYVVQMLLTNEEVNKLFEAAREKYGDMPEVALEERLADDFADYVRGIDVEESKIRRFFRELWNAIKALFGKKAFIENLYRDINTGVYSGTEFKADDNNAFSNISDASRDLARSYEYLTDGERQRVLEAGVDRNIFNSMDKEQQEYMLHCVV